MIDKIRNIPKINPSPELVLILFVLLNLVIGASIYQDYGHSTDEGYELWQSKLVLNIYNGEVNEDPGSQYAAADERKYYGTALNIIPRIVERIVLGKDVRDSTFQLAHLTYFIIFQTAIVATYYLGAKFFSKWTSLVVAVLFGTQPLLFGHALINPKDIPLLASFLVSATAGFYLVEGLMSRADSIQGESSDPSLKKKRTSFLTILILLGLLLWASPLLTPLADRLIEYSYLTRGVSPLGKLFDTLTTSGSLAGYQTLGRLLVLDIQRWMAFLSVPILVVLFLWAQRQERLGIHADLAMLGAAALWGLAISTRVIAFAAGGIVGLYAIIKLRQQSIIPLLIYSVTAGIVSFISWPFLWIYGLKGIFTSLFTFADFTYWHKQLLFEGQLLFPEELPRYYLPKLMFLQFTEPMVLLALAGFIITLVLLWRRKIDAAGILLILAWFIVPLSYVIISRPVLYNNFRQFLFITPPLFILAGLFLEQIIGWIKPNILRALFALAILVPGIFALVQLHPYQYVYYNQFTGGVEGAFRHYELDYWSTSYKETMEIINNNLSPGSKIIVWGNEGRLERYAENKYQIVGVEEIPEYAYYLFDYAVIPTRRFIDVGVLPDAPTAYKVEVDNAILMFIKKIP